MPLFGPQFSELPYQPTAGRRLAIDGPESEPVISSQVETPASTHPGAVVRFFKKAERTLAEVPEGGVDRQNMRQAFDIGGVLAGKVAMGFNEDLEDPHG
ncbi:MAG: hypothetical protein WCO52_01230 [bacterium]